MNKKTLYLLPISLFGGLCLSASTTTWGDEPEKSPGTASVSTLSQLEKPASSLLEDAAYDGEKYVLPPLPYDYNALEPYIDAQTMQLHHDKHHAAYVAGANAAVQKLREIAEGKGDASLATHWARQLSFHTSGHAMHCIFWQNMAPPAKAPEENKPSTPLTDALKNSFGSYDGFVKAFKAVSTGVEGSGWGVLAYEPISGKLIVLGMEKHQNLTATGAIPLLVCDVWEHAYYLKYQNNRVSYVDNFMNVINWKNVSDRYEKAKAGKN